MKKIDNFKNNQNRLNLMLISKILEKQNIILHFKNYIEININQIIKHVKVSLVKNLCMTHLEYKKYKINRKNWMNNLKNNYISNNKNKKKCLIHI